jgi:hypothetical protein
MQLLDIIAPSRLEMIEQSARRNQRFDFEDSPEYKEMVRRATDSLQHIQDSIRSAVTDSAQAITDTVQAAVPISGHYGDGTGMTLLTIVGSLAALAACTYLIVKSRKTTTQCNC